MLIILAVVSINAIFGADGLVAQARRTDLIVKFTVYLEEKKNYDSEKKYEDSDYNEESLNAGRTTLAYNTQGEDTEGNIQTVIPSMDDEYAGMFEIIKGEFYLYAASDLEREVATELGIQVSPYLIDNGVLLSANANLGLQTENGVVTLPERVTEIEQGAFSGVTGLKEVIIPGTVKVIDDDAFSYNTEIEKVTIEDGVLSIGTNAFKGCSSLKEVVMPDSVIEVGSIAFGGCSNLTTVQLSNNLTTLNSYVFSSCNLATIDIPSNITNIESNAFNSCRNLNNINIPAGVTSIASNAFNNCTSLYNLTIDEANPVYEVEDGIIYTKDNSTLIMLAPMAKADTITIREEITQLGSNALSMCTSMTILNLPSTLSNINGYTFSGARLLETINFPNGNENYMSEDGYLYNIDKTELIFVVPTKKEINIDASVKIIKTASIYNENIIEFIIPDSVETLESAIFQGASRIKKIEIGSGVNTLSPTFKAWSRPSSGLEITIDEENPYYKVEGNLILTKDGKEVVTYINRVQNQIIPERVEKLQSGAFTDFSTATEIVLPSTLKEIGNQAFTSCTSLIEIQIPNNVETIGTNAFVNCSKLETINIDKEKDSISGSPWSVPKGERAIIWLK